MKWILYMMLFTTPAANVTNKDDATCLKMSTVDKINQISVCRPLFEAKRVWSLQTTSQVEFALYDSCVRAQDLLVANSNVASTMTLRTWCICEAENGKCPTNAQLHEIATSIRECEKNDSAECQVNTSKKIQNFTAEKGQNSSSIRLYPPAQ
jgi:hypothetical protein